MFCLDAEYSRLEVQRALPYTLHCNPKTFETWIKGADAMLSSETTAFRLIVISVDKGTTETYRDGFGSADKEDAVLETWKSWSESGCLSLCS
jgi:hypothetical protein